MQKKIEEAQRNKEKYGESESVYQQALAAREQKSFDEAYKLAASAQALFSREEIVSLLNDLSKKIKTDNNFKKFMEAGEKSYSAGEYEVSLREYEKALKINPDDFFCKFGVNRAQGYIYVSSDAEESIKFFEAALQLKPNDIECSIEISKLFIKLDKNDEALSYLEPLKAVNPEISQLLCKLYVEKGMKSYENENYKEAYFFFEEAYKRDDGDNGELICINLAWACLGKKDFSNSIAYLEEAAKINPQNAAIKDIMSLVYNRQGEAMLEQGLNDPAIEHFKQAASLLKENIYQNNLVVAYQNQQSYKKALEEINKIEGKGVEYNRSISIHTKILEALTQDFRVSKEDKEKYYKQMINLHPKNANCFYEYAKFLVDNNYEARIYVHPIKQGHAIDPDNQNIIQLAGDQVMELDM